jgi:hypothetical protein
MSRSLNSGRSARFVRIGLGAAIVPALMLVVAVGLLAQQHHLIVSAKSTSYRPYVGRPTGSGSLALGVTTGPLARNAWRVWRAGDLRSVDAFERVAHAHARIVMWYADWGSNRVSIAQLNEVYARGSVPEITWEPWDANNPVANQPAYRLSNIIAGKFDGYVRRWARALAHWHKTLYLRFAQEMNGYWYPWADAANDNRPGQFVAAWRHIHGIFTRAGATNVKWVWSPYSGAPRGDFPGVHEVDVIGVTCLNGAAADQQPWHSFAQQCGHSISQLHALAPALPIQASETGCTNVGGNKAAWITDMFSYLARHPIVKSMICFNLNKETEWRVQSSPAAERAFSRGLPEVGLK